ncbi:hypothetical protein [Erythrobacter sp. WG]|uniref:hypothetical protein n=1 Tax=Erythrobacter sp. WG TaxID=2985510 RepID=UPI00227189A7|nr:hypothetical protein [Erythrobacter sp. WG]
MTRASRASLLERWDALGRPFARLPRRGAMLMLAALAAAMAWSAFAVVPRGGDAATTSASSSAASAPRKGSGDLALYAAIHARMARGEGYYDAAFAEHRARNYPTQPFVAVRLPTLAWLQIAVGLGGVRYCMIGLVAASLFALHRGLRGIAAWHEEALALVILALGGAAVMALRAGLIHELWAGLCLTLALLLYREHRCAPALLAAAGALAVRELALPFVLLWLAFALAGKRWREAAGVVGLLLAFAVGMALHFMAVDALRLPGDPVSQGWSAFAGAALPLTAVWRLTGLHDLPLALGAPLAILPLLGWLSLGGRLGLLAALWFAGLGLMTALFARPENYYWVQLALPAYGIGLAFAPRALGELVRAAARQT